MKRPSDNGGLAGGEHPPVGETHAGLRAFFQRFNWRRQNQRMERLLRDAGRLVDPEQDDELLSYWAGSHVTRNTPTPLKHAWKRFHVRVQSDPERRAMWDQAMERRKQVERDSDARAHFKRLIATPDTPCRSAYEDKRPGSRASFAQQRRSIRRRLEVGDVGVEPSRRPQKHVRVVMVRKSLVAIVSLYLVTSAISFTFRPELERRAAIDLTDMSWARLGQTTRGVNTGWRNDVRLGYSEALKQAGSAASWFIPFRHVDRERLINARSTLEQTIEYQGRQEITPSRAYLILGKMNILLDEPGAAREALEMARTRGGEPGREAGRLLELMQE